MSCIHKNSGWKSKDPDQNRTIQRRCVVDASSLIECGHIYYTRYGIVYYLNVYINLLLLLFFYFITITISRRTNISINQSHQTYFDYPNHPSTLSHH